MVEHNIHPFIRENSRLLILGSFPSVKSREQRFFYSHPQNRFWSLLARMYSEPLPCTIQDKKALLIRHHIALWDVIASCTISGSSDSSIRDVTPHDIGILLTHAPIDRIFTNGQTAHRLYQRFIYPSLGISDTCLPSTSPANARMSFENLLAVWKEILGVNVPVLL